ncbi:metal ABC transporter substrate-binding protein [Lipingzhangella sp. LS1_29]|uniref:Metal ABC transporter substrate-binding protein n=1 Tax=Lipingzhangella rawalii TaxID=2055835 RepID=A0ABU2H2W1_9ACTN|nr:metal ABC transporter substrate-binding protein [Lipingzhangella rawalii]MDS1269190.1 metal ABC transporter substrate-binding protein [Lipingzhangella rawalii]
MANKGDWANVKQWGVVVVGLTTVAACGAAPAETEDDPSERPTVLTTFTVLADMAEAVGGDAVHVESITRVGAEIHGYEPTPDDLVRGQDADLILDNGLGLEAWFDQFTDRVDAPSVTVTDGIEEIPIASGDHEGEANPHTWMSVHNGHVYVDNIAAALIDLAPQAESDIEANAETYHEQLETIATGLTERLEEIPEQHRALVTCEGAFSYLARDVGLTEHYLWPVNAETEGTPQQIADVVEFVSDNNVPTVFCESTVNDSAQRQVAQETGAELGTELYVDSLSEPDGPVPTYLDMLEHNAEAIADGLEAQ